MSSKHSSVPHPVSNLSIVLWELMALKGTLNINHPNHLSLDLMILIQSSKSFVLLEYLEMKNFCFLH
jgi:hypothetical protein